MTKREFLDIVFALAPNEANKIMDAFDEYMDSNEPHWIPVTEDTLPEENRVVVVCGNKGTWDFGTYRTHLSVFIGGCTKKMHYQNLTRG